MTTTNLYQHHRRPRRRLPGTDPAPSPGATDQAVLRRCEVWLAVGVLTA